MKFDIGFCIYIALFIFKNRNLFKMTKRTREDINKIAKIKEPHSFE